MFDEAEGVLIPTIDYFTIRIIFFVAIKEMILIFMRLFNILSDESRC